MEVNKQSVAGDQTGEIHVPIDSKLDGRMFLQHILNKLVKIEISDGRTLIGQFLCTDSNKNIILGSCQEFIGNPDSDNCDEPRALGLAMVPGRHVKSMLIDLDEQTHEHFDATYKCFGDVKSDDTDKIQGEALER